MADDNFRSYRSRDPLPRDEADQIANDEDPAVRKAVDERKESFLQLGLTGQGMYGAADEHAGTIVIRAEPITPCARRRARPPR